MDGWILSLTEPLLLVLALSTDSFVASFAYGTNHIRIPFSSTLVISSVCSAVLGVSLLAGALFLPLVPSGFVHAICFCLLFLLGIVKIFDSSLKAVIRSAVRRKKKLRKNFAFSALHLNFILTVYANPEQADLDCSRLLSPGEAFSLAAALSLDGLAVGFGAALGSVPIWQSLLFSLVIGTAAVQLGAFLGNHLAKHITLDLSWIGGVLLLILAFLKL